MSVKGNGSTGEIVTSSTAAQSDTWTIACWYKSATTPASGTSRAIWAAQSDDGSALYNMALLWTHTSLLTSFHIKDATPSFQSRQYAGSINANTWHHFAITYDGTDVEMWLDGSSDGTLNIAAGITSGKNVNTQIHYWAGTQWGDGDLAEWAWYHNTVLSDAEIGVLAKGFSPLLVRPGAIRYYKPLVRRSVIDLFQPGSLWSPSGGLSVTEHPRVIYPHAIDECWDRPSVFTYAVSHLLELGQDETDEQPAAISDTPEHNVALGQALQLAFEHQRLSQNVGLKQSIKVDTNVLASGRFKETEGEHDNA